MAAETRRVAVLEAFGRFKGGDAPCDEGGLPRIASAGKPQLLNRARRRVAENASK